MVHKMARLIVAGLLLLASVTLVACGGPEAAEISAEQPAGGVAKVVIFVGMGTGTDPDQIDAQEALAEEFNSTHDDIEIEFLIVPHEEARERYLAMLSGGDAPELVGPNGVETIAEFLDTWVDIRPFIEAENFDMSDFYGATIDLNTYPDKLVGLPLGVYPSMIFYNQDLFDAAGLPYPTHDFQDKSWTMDVLRDYAMQLTLDANGNNATSPDFDPTQIVQWGWDDSWEGARGALAMWGAENVARPTSSDYRTATANNPEWIYGLQWISDGIWVDHFIPDLAGQEVYGAVGAGDPFGSGMVAMFYSYTWFFAEGLVDLPFEYNIAPLPYNHKGTRIERIDADLFTMPEGAENKEAAWEVMKWLTSAEHINDVCSIYGCIPARVSVQDSFRADVLEKRWPGLDYSVVFEAINWLDNPNHESWVPEWGRVEDVMNNALSLVYSGEEKDAQVILDQANAEIQAILDEYWASQP